MYKEQETANYAEALIDIFYYNNKSVGCRLGVPLLHLFVFMPEQQNGSSISLQLFYYSMHLQRWHQCWCYLLFLEVYLLVYYCTGRTS